MPTNWLNANNTVNQTQIKQEEEDVVLVPDGNGNMVDPSLITRKYLGVTYHKRNKKWIAQASENGRSKYLGCFKTPEKAARMYDAYVVSQSGENVKTNFPASEIDPTLKPLVKRYRKRSRDVISTLQAIPSISAGSMDPWETYMSNLTQQCSKRRKRTRDPSAPKGPRNAYMMYIQKTREKLQKECQETPLEEGNSFGAISRELGRRWKMLDPEKKRVFEEMAATDKVRYEKEKEEYEAKIESETKRTQEALMNNMDSFQQQYNEYAQIQSQWLQMMGYTQQAPPNTDPTTGVPQSYYDPSALNQLQQYYSHINMDNQLSVSNTTDMYEQLGYNAEELQALQKAYYSAAQQSQLAMQQMNQLSVPTSTKPCPQVYDVKDESSEAKDSSLEDH